MPSIQERPDRDVKTRSNPWKE